jgi:hypothetical protein
MLVADARYYCGSGLNWREAEAEKQGRSLSPESPRDLELVNHPDIGAD